MSPDHSQEREGKGACGRRQPYQICVFSSLGRSSQLLFIHCSGNNPSQPPLLVFKSLFRLTNIECLLQYMTAKRKQKTTKKELVIASVVKLLMI